MIFVDASAAVAIIAQEPDAAELAAKLQGAPEAWTSALAHYESVTGLARALKLTVGEASLLVGELGERFAFDWLAIDSGIAQAAVEAFARYGKGRHRANLNMGDCFAYACARTLDAALLCKGDDFLHTDIRLA
ncbi:MAG TPA: type II toxin-antitoxin system VapC family toxin [Rhizomicrobium sp.]|jgi:ribonuclease VapC